jgi:two-component system alkaline phosphatase synthesis response regulator PhoP
MAKHILVVEDDLDIGRLLEMHLTDLAYVVEIAKTGVEGLQYVLSKRYDLIILDVMLPGVDGLEICRQIRSLPSLTHPSLMLTAKSSELDRVLGLEVGADDYLTKPFSVRELLARDKGPLPPLGSIQVIRRRIFRNQSARRASTSMLRNERSQ